MTRLTDLSERDLLRSTAREVFASHPTPADIASLGWLGLLTGEDSGGEGWFPVEAALIALEGGQAGTASTWFMSALAAGFVSNSPDACEWTEALLSGQLVGSFAPVPDLDTKGGGATGTARKLLSERAPDVVVLAGPPASATVAIATRDGDVRLDANRKTLETERSLFRLDLHNVRAHSVGQSAAKTLTLAASLLLCADTVGALSRAVQIVTKHLMERDAFEVPLASFQVLQHRLVDLVTLQNASEALVLSATTALAEGEPKAERLTLAAHAYIEGRAVAAIDDCVQLAGGIGFTWEFPIHHALRRAATNAALFESGRSSRRRLAVLEGWAP